MTRRHAARDAGRAPTMALRSLLLVPLLLLASGVAAGAVDGQPVPWQLGLQEPATGIAREINDFHNFLLVIITLVSLFVLGLLVYVMWKFNEKANPVPSKVSHNTTIEVVWTVAPILILLVIAVPSFRLLFKQYDFPKPDVVVKATGSQWFWTYQYPDEGGMSFDSLMVRDDNYAPAAGPNGEPRTLAVDNYLVVPVNKNVELLITANDVIHAWTVPAFGVKVDAVPGRVLRAWFRAEKEGTFYGQCSELCGKDHAFMPIGVRVVSDEVYKQWLEGAKKQFGTASHDAAPRRVAQAPAAAQ
jgi:cytochrome c oxidase subunit 2